MGEIYSIIMRCMQVVFCGVKWQYASKDISELFVVLLLLLIDQSFKKTNVISF